MWMQSIIANDILNSIFFWNQRGYKSGKTFSRYLLRLTRKVYFFTLENISMLTPQNITYVNQIKCKKSSNDSAKKWQNNYGLDASQKQVSKTT